MHRGTALPLTSCSNKAEGHSSCQCCSQRLARGTNRGLFSVRPPPSLPAASHAPTALGGARGDVCGAALSGGTVRPRTAVQKLCVALEQTSVLTAELWCHRGIDQKHVCLRVLIPDLQFKTFSDTHAGSELFVKRSPASPGRPRVQLIPHAWGKYHLCLFGNKGGTC